MRAVALLGPVAREHHVRQFEMPGVNLFTGNDLHPSDEPGAVLIFGGDGTFHRHLGGLALRNTPTLIVPFGSANDFARSLGISSVEQALAAWRRFCTAGDNVREVDLGTVEPLNPPPQPGSSTAEPWEGESLESLHFVPDGPRTDLPRMGPRIMQSQLRQAADVEHASRRAIFFGSIAGTGLDAAVNRITLEQPRWLRAHGGYVVALLRVLGRFKPPRVTLSTQVDGAWHTRLAQPGFLIAMGNGPQYGHGMRLTHEACMDDGLLEACFVQPMNKLRLLRLFRVVYRGGHIGMKEVEYFRAAKVRIATEPVTEVFADGEYVCRTPVEIGVLQKALRVIVPS